MKTAKFTISVLFVGLAFVLTVKPVFAASLSLSPSSANKTVGEEFDVDIVLDTQGAAVSGATAIINYDTSKLQVVDGDTSDSVVSIAPGSELTQVLTNSVNTSAGQIRYDAGALGSSYTGRATIATITFKPVATGVGKASFVFNKNATKNTSAVAAASGPTNLLEEINDGTYTINSSDGSSSSDSSTLPETGVVEDTVLAVFGGLAFLAVSAALAWKAAIFRF